MDLSSSMALWLDGLVAILLVVTVGYCLMLNRRLTGLRANQAEMRKLLSDFTEATKQAEISVSHLKTASDRISGSLDDRMTEARALADELASITQSGGRLAERIENGLVGRANPAQRAAPKPEDQDATVKMSESERELAEILRQAR
jgi:hypothetical protein